MKKVLGAVLVLALGVSLIIPTAAVMACHPNISIEKTTLGCNGEYGDDVDVITGSTVTWRYIVTNIGDNGSYLNGVTVVDNMPGVVPVLKEKVGGDQDDRLEKGEKWIYEAAGIAVSGNYQNIGTATGCYPGVAPYIDSDSSSYIGGDPKISIDKQTNGGDGLEIEVGQPVYWAYAVYNGGNVALSNIAVTDSDPGVIPAYVSGDGNANHELDPDETWVYSATGTAVSGEYSNIGTVTGEWVCSKVTDTDDSSYIGEEGGGGGQEEPEVGGDVLSIDKFGLLLPWLTMGAMIIFGVWLVRRKMAANR